MLHEVNVSQRKSNKSLTISIYVELTMCQTFMRKAPQTGKCEGTCFFSNLSPILTVFTSVLEAELGRFVIHTLYPHVNHDVCIQVIIARINLHV